MPVLRDVAQLGGVVSGKVDRNPGFGGIHERMAFIAAAGHHGDVQQPAGVLELLGILRRCGPQPSGEPGAAAIDEVVQLRAVVGVEVAVVRCGSRIRCRRLREVAALAKHRDAGDDRTGCGKRQDGAPTPCDGPAARTGFLFHVEVLPGGLQSKGSTLGDHRTVPSPGDRGSVGPAAGK